MSIKDNVNVEHVKQWTAALRSGEYAQGLSALCDIYPVSGAHYCCLGVGCDVAGIPYVTAEYGSNPYDQQSPTHLRKYGKEGDVGYAPSEFHRWLWSDELTAQSQERQDFMEALINLNDDEILSFAEIADYIEKQLL